MLAGAGSAQAATATFSSTGGEQTFTVPAGVTTLHVVAIGGRGGSWRGLGGFGATASGDMPVAAGQVLYIEVAGNGSSPTTRSSAPGGFNGGGNGPRLGAGAGAGGGGASDVRMAPSVVSCK